jgi:ppGpp synthetase/RelA/SpoT-type nucleotidyltranferase
MNEVVYMTAQAKEGYIMSEQQYDRLETLMQSVKDSLAAFKTEMKVDIGALRTDVEVIRSCIKDYDEIVEKVNKQDKDIELLKTDCTHIKSNCVQIQELKRQQKAQPGAVKTGIIVGGVVAVIGGIISIIINLLS